MTAQLLGPYTVLMTPLDEMRRQDEKSLERLVDYYLNGGIKGFVVLGESAERDRLTVEERESNLSIVFRAVNKRVPIVIGAGQEGTESTVEASVRAESMGASAVMVPPPRNTKLRDEAIFNFFATVGDSIKIPILVQDLPQTDRPYMSPELIAKINREVKNAEYLKLEDPPTPQKLTKIKTLVGDKMKIFGALLGRNSFYELDRGAVGIMTATPTPEYLVRMFDAYVSGKRTEALNVFLYTLPLVYYGSEFGLGVRKSILVQRGVISTSKMKQPAYELNALDQKELAECLAWVESKLEKEFGLKPFRLDRG